MAEHSELKAAKQASQAQDREPTDIDVSAVLSEHKYRFIYDSSQELRMH